MYASSVRQALGFDDALVARARAEGLLVGRGEGFTSREWRAGGGPLVAVHTDAADRELLCAIPFVAGLRWGEAHLVGVKPGAQCPHCTTVHLRAPGFEVRATIPDHAARRKMLPVGLDVQASVLVVVADWRPGDALEALVTPVREGEPDAVVVSGTLLSVAPLRNEAANLGLVRCEVGAGAGRLTLVGPEKALEVGARVTATGRALARIGAPKAVRG